MRATTLRLVCCSTHYVVTVTPVWLFDSSCSPRFTTPRAHVYFVTVPAFALRYPHTLRLPHPGYYGLFPGYGYTDYTYDVASSVGWYALLLRYVCYTLPTHGYTRLRLRPHAGCPYWTHVITRARHTHTFTFHDLRFTLLFGLRLRLRYSVDYAFVTRTPVTHTVTPDLVRLQTLHHDARARFCVALDFTVVTVTLNGCSCLRLHVAVAFYARLVCVTLLRLPVCVLRWITLWLRIHTHWVHS